MEVLRANPLAEVCDQLDRASLSALLNTAEGNGKRQRQVRAKFFDDARGSATECAGCLDALVAKKAVAEERILDGKKILVRIVSMLCGLVDRFDSTADRMREEPVEYHINSVKNSRTRTRTRTRTTAYSVLAQATARCTDARHLVLCHRRGVILV